jgi:hypothetical protein
MPDAAVSTPMIPPDEVVVVAAVANNRVPDELYIFKNGLPDWLTIAKLFVSGSTEIPRTLIPTNHGVALVIVISIVPDGEYLYTVITPVTYMFPLVSTAKPHAFSTIA